MQLITSLLAFAAVLGLSSAQQKNKDPCALYDYYSGSGYEFLNNLWGKDAGNGSQCTYVDSDSPSGVSWHSTWTWKNGPNNVKSYPYSGLLLPKKPLLSQVKSMKSSASWSYNTSDIRANVAYDLFTSTDSNHTNSFGDYELMIWLGKYGDISPIGSSVGIVKVDGQDWDLWRGFNGAMKVFSFVAVKPPMTKFSGDLKAFFDYMATKGFEASSQYLITYQIGSEAFTGGPATFTFHNWSAGLELKSKRRR
ncbi:related to endoglucanase I precursor [Rhynchosporium graminicola]|uniref:Related to endoglucanase I n=2 Tax=Rhynchosporium TaxID=38037 RepID=A0A1E1MKJ2_RHYSE|nr:related to endoglucanase I precursor [Rhynchosporium commune]CZT49590.1 related to endoglucanase I precursor [Rhynchosporium secalis]